MTTGHCQHRTLRIAVYSAFMCLLAAGGERLAAGAVPQIAGITPNTWNNSSTATITNLAGMNFQAGATVRLTKTGVPDIAGASVTVVSTTKITCTFDLRYAPNGPRDVVVTNPGNQTGTLTNGFRVNQMGLYSTVVLPVSAASLAWGDYDNDNDLDLLEAGSRVGTPIARIFTNNGSGSFADLAAGLTGARYSAVAWGDYDRDGFLDVVVCGEADTGSARYTKIYRNLGNGSFTDISANLLGVMDAAAAWGDYDNDGDLDLVVSGWYYDTQGRFSTKIYRNDNGTFSDAGAGLTGIAYGAVAWGDYDNDGDLDLAITGRNTNTLFARVYRNDNGVFTDIQAAIPGVTDSAVAWGDYDNDGDLDLAVAGATASSRITGIYRNDNGTFTDINAGLVGVSLGSLAWGDYDNDGDLDLGVAGYYYDTTYHYVTKLCRNDGNGVFVDTQEPNLTGVSGCSMAWGDCDNDGDLDLAVTGGASNGSDVFNLYQNTGLGVNTPPTSPTNLTAGGTEAATTFAWAAAQDSETPALGLSYNLRVGTAPGQADIVDPMANLVTGRRKVPALGNAQKRLGWTLKKLLPGTYYWSVQAIDTAFAGSAWAPEQTVQITNAAPMVTSISPNSDWNYDYNGEQTSVTINGGFFEPGVTVKLTRAGRPDVVGTNIVLNTNYLNCSLSLTGVAPGAWDVVVTNTDGQSGVLANGFTVLEAPAPTVSSVSPVSGANTGTIDNVTLACQYAQYGVTVQLVHAGQPDIAATGVTVVDAGSVTCSFNLAGALADYWDVVVTNPDNRTGTLARGFSVHAFSIQSFALPDGFCPGPLAWGDYDQDGDLDVAVAGGNSDNWPARRTLIFRNDGGTFVNANVALSGVTYSALAWGDYDSDGDLDLVVTGLGTQAPGYLTKIYRNDNGAFTDIGAALTGVRDGAVAWGDCDNDGDLDLALAGYYADNTSHFVTRIYRNDGNGVFTDINAGLTGVTHAALAWGDYDKDGDLDLAVCGYYYDPQGHYVARIYRNDGGGLFTEATNLSVLGSFVIHYLAWGDYNNDGRLDLLAGTAGEVSTTFVYRNDGNGQFTQLSTGCPPAMSWGDYDNDGDLDIVGGGRLFRNDGQDTFTDAAALSAFGGGVWGDYDHDGRLDLLGAWWESSRFTLRIGHNVGTTFNSPPTPPTGLVAVATGSSIAFTWNAARDNETPVAGLSYNLRVGRLSGGGDVLSGQADLAGGVPFLPALGNVQENCAWTLRGLPPGQYYWSVQTIDSACAGSAWAPEQTVVVPTPGDANRDNQVTFEDFSILQNNYGESPRTWEQGDFSGNGRVGFEDFAILQNNYGQGEAAGTLPAASGVAGGCGAVGMLVMSGVGMVSSLRWWGRRMVWAMALLSLAGTSAKTLGGEPEWMWQNPLPQGNDLFGVWGSGPDDVFAVGRENTILHYNGSIWSAMPTGTIGEDICAVWGSGPNDVFAVGTNDTILHFDGRSWSAMPSGTTWQFLYGVWGSGPNDVFAVGDEGTIIHYDGTSWTPMGGGTSDMFFGIWGSGPTDVFAAGWSGTILHYDGTSWSVMSTGTNQDLQAIWGRGPNDVFAVGSYGTILHYNGTAWSAMASGTMEHLYGVCGRGSGDVYAVGYRGTILHYDGASWSSMISGTTGDITAIGCDGSGDLFAVGDAGVIVHHDGAAWSVMRQGTTNSLNGAWGSGPNDVFAVGRFGTIVHYDGADWSPMASGTTKHLMSAWGSGPADVFAVGYGGTILHYDGTAWSAMTSGTTRDLCGIWGSGAGNVFAVGYGGTILRYSASSWSPMTSGTTQNLLAVWGSGPADVFAVGYSDTGNNKILHYDGTSWSAMSAGSISTLKSIWGSGPADVFAAGNVGTILHYNGTTWSAMASGEGYMFAGIWGSGPNNVFAVPQNAGVIRHYNGSAWQPMTTGTRNDFYGVWGSGANDVFAVGAFGTILHHAARTVHGAITLRDYVPDVGGILVDVELRNPGERWARSIRQVTLGSDGTYSLTTCLPAGNYDLSMKTGTWLRQTVSNVGVVSATTTVDFSLANGDANGDDRVSFTDFAILQNHYGQTGRTGSQGEFNGDQCVTFEDFSILQNSYGQSGQTNDLPAATAVGGCAPTGMLAVFGVVLGGLSLGWRSRGIFAVALLILAGTCVTARGEEPRWAWQNPVVQGNELVGVWGTGPNDLYAVGAADTIVHYNGATWSVMPTGTTGRTFAAIWGSGPSDVFAVGTAGTILHHTGTGWSAMVSGTIDDLNAIWGTGPNNVYAVGGNYTILHYNGTAWSTMSSGVNIVLRGIWGSAANNIFAVGDAGTILRYDGTGWQSMTSGTTQALYGAWGSGPNNVYAVGSNDTIRHYDGAAWQNNATGTPKMSFLAVWGTGSNNVYMLGISGTIWHSDGASWSVMSTGFAGGLGGLWGSDSSDIYAVGLSGTVLRYDGSAWAVLIGGITYDLNGIWGSSSTNIYAVGNGGTMFHGDGTHWFPVITGVTRTLRAVWGSGAGDIFAAGDQDTILHYNGSTWTTMNSGAGSVCAFYGVWGTGPSNVYALGDNGSYGGVRGIILRYNGSVWTPVTSGYHPHFAGIWGNAANDIYVVGWSGAIRHYNGSTWSTMINGPTGDLTAVWGSGAQNVYVVSQQGSIHRYNGSSWTTVYTAPHGLSAIWGSGPNDVYAAGYEGMMLHYDGAAWSAMTTGTANYLRGIWGGGSNDVSAVGANAMILHHADLTVQGTITLQDYLPGAAGHSVAVELSNPGEHWVRTAKTATVGTGGAYSFITNLPAGTYDLSIKTGTWLRQTVGNVALSAGTATVDFSLVNGDINGDDRVSFGDFSVLQNNYGQSGRKGSEGDLNGDGSVTFEDFSILQNNYSRSGATLANAPAAEGTAAPIPCAMLGLVILVMCLQSGYALNSVVMSNAK